MRNGLAPTFKVTRWRKVDRRLVPIPLSSLTSPPHYPTPCPMPVPPSPASSFPTPSAHMAQGQGPHAPLG